MPGAIIEPQLLERGVTLVCRQDLRSATLPQRLQINARRGSALRQQRASLRVNNYLLSRLRSFRRGVDLITDLSALLREQPYVDRHRPGADYYRPRPDYIPELRHHRL